MTKLKNSNTSANKMDASIPRNKLHLEINPEFNIASTRNAAQPIAGTLLKRHALTAVLVLMVAGVGAALLNAFGASTGNTGSVISVIPAVLLG